VTQLRDRLSPSSLFEPWLEKPDPGSHDPGRGWTIAKLEAAARRRGSTADDRLLGLFDVLDDLFNRADREARTFVEVLAEISRGRPLGDDGIDIVVSLRALVITLAEEAGLERTSEFLASWQVLARGALLRVIDGDLDSARRSRQMTVDLVAHHRPVAASPSFEEDQQFDYDYDLVGYAEPNGVETAQSAGAELRTRRGHSETAIATAAVELDGYRSDLHDLEWLLS
jgi:hypothetical protein